MPQVTVDRRATALQASLAPVVDLPLGSSNDATEPGSDKLPQGLPHAHSQLHQLSLPRLVDANAARCLSPVTLKQLRRHADPPGTAAAPVPRTTIATDLHPTQPQPFSSPVVSEPDVDLHWTTHLLLSQPTGSAAGKQRLEEPSDVHLSVRMQRCSDADGPMPSASAEYPLAAQDVPLAHALPPAERASFPPPVRAVQADDIREFARRVKQAGSVDNLRALDPAFVHSFLARSSSQLRRGASSLQ
jgi:hypothetical protein